MNRTRRRFVLLSLTAVNLLLLVAAVCDAGLQNGWYSDCCSVAVLMSQGMLLAIWCALGTSKLVVRAAGFVGGSAILILWYSATEAQHRDHSLASFLTRLLQTLRVDWFSNSATILTYVGIVTLVLAIVRIAGLRLVSFVAPIAPHGQRWPRYSLWQLLVLTGVVALLLSGGGPVRNLVIESRVSPYWTSHWTGGIGSAIIAGLALWSTLSPAPPLVRVVLANLAAWLVAFGMACMLAEAVHPMRRDLVGAAVQTFCLCGWLLVVRACGYRAVWPANYMWIARNAEKLEPGCEL